MTTLKVKIESFDAMMSQVGQARRAPAHEISNDNLATLSFPSWEMMHRVLAPKRLQIVQVMAGQGPLSMREIARRVGRDFKGVHSDIETLLKSGVIDKATDGGVEFPYDRLHFEFEIEAAA